MQKIVYSFLISLIVTAVSAIFLIVVGVGFRKVPWVLIISDVILILLYYDEILNQRLQDSTDLNIIFLYIFITIICLIIYSIYVCSTNTSGRCICRRCRNPSYEEIKSYGDL
jgi:hypothetical protein